MNETEWLTPGEAAKRLDRSTQRIRDYCDQGDLRFTRFGPQGFRLIDAASVEELRHKLSQRETARR